MTSDGDIFEATDPYSDTLKQLDTCCNLLLALMSAEAEGKAVREASNDTQASATSGSDGDIAPFHPAYALTEGNLPILQSSDSVCFRFDITKLAAHSSFFRDCFDLPLTATGADPIPFPNTKAAVLKLVLDTASADDPATVTPVVQLPVTQDFVDECIAFTDAHFCPIILGALYRACAADESTDWTVRFVLATLGSAPWANYNFIDHIFGNQMAIIHRAKIVPRLRGQPWWLDRLQRWAPSCFPAIESIFDSKVRFQRIIAGKLLDNPKRNRWSKKCYKCRGQVLCETYMKYKGRYSEFRRLVTPALVSKAFATPSKVNRAFFTEALQKVRCSVCRNRLALETWETWKREVQEPAREAVWVWAVE